MVLTQCSRNLGLIIGQGSLQRRAWREETCGWVISEYQTCIWYVYAIASKTVQVSRTMLAYVVIRTVSCIETSSGIILCLLWSSTRTKGISDISGHWNGIGLLNSWLSHWSDLRSRNLPLDQLGSKPWTSCDLAKGYSGYLATSGVLPCHSGESSSLSCHLSWNLREPFSVHALWQHPAQLFWI